MNPSEIHAKAAPLELLAEQHSQSALAEQLNAMPMEERIAVAREMDKINVDKTSSDLNVPRLVIHTGTYAGHPGKNETGVKIGTMDKPTLGDRAQIALGKEEGDANHVVHWQYKSTQPRTPNDPELLRTSNY
jgi:hypothetical protein